MGQPIRYEDFLSGSRASAMGEDENVELMLARARGQARAEGFAEGAAEAESRFDAELATTIEAVGAALQAAMGDDAARRRELGAALREVVATFLTAFAPRLAEFNLVEEIAAAVAEAADDVKGGFVVELSPASKPGVEAGLGDIAASAVFRANETLSPAEARVHWNGGFDEINAAGAVTRAIALIDARLAASALPPGTDPYGMNAEDTFAAFDGSHDAEANAEPDGIAEDESTGAADHAPAADPGAGFDMPADDASSFDADAGFAPSAGLGAEMDFTAEGDAGFGTDLSEEAAAPEMPAFDEAAPDIAASETMGDLTDLGMGDEPREDDSGLSADDADTGLGDMPEFGDAALADLGSFEGGDASASAMSAEAKAVETEADESDTNALADLAAGDAFAADPTDTEADDDFPALDFAFDGFDGADDDTPPL